jgi:hypothetical protein
MEVQLPWMVRPWVRMHVSGVVPATVGEGEAAEDVQPVFALGGVAPERAADEGVDAVGADQYVVLSRTAVGEVQRDHAFVLFDAGHLLVEAHDVVG